jgi:hypothetical protein
MPPLLQAFELDGETVWVEVSDVVTTAPQSTRFGSTSASGSGSEAGSATKLANLDLGKTLRAALGPVSRALADIDLDLEEANVELAIGIKGEVGFFLARGETNASLKVAVKLKRPKGSAGTSS